MSQPEKLHLLQIVSNICGKYRCTIKEIDFDSRLLNIKGPEDDPDARARCVAELESALELYYQEEPPE